MEPTHPLAQLDDADLEFVLQFVLASGSLKEMARIYGVSYPTIRARLDRVIMQLRDVASKRPSDPMSSLLAGLLEEGQLSSGAARDILKLYKTLQQGET